jgi:iron complex transport system substrate-binding protein
MRGAAVTVPVKIERVVAISDGFVAGVMSFLGEEQKLVGLGSRCVQTNFSYEYTSAEGTSYRYDNGMNPVAFLHPELKDLPLVAASNLALNYETLAGLRPDVAILRAGSCTFGSLDDENTQKTIRTIEAIGIPLIVLKGPPCYDQPTLAHLSEEILLIGRLFGQEERARRLAAYLEEEARQIRERTQGIPEEDKKRVLLLGLSPRVRASGGAGNTKGTDTIESYFMESFANAKNAYEGPGGRANYAILSAEQIYALDPDVILLPTSSGYHPTRELYSAPYFKNLQALRAVKERNVYALPWTPCNCAKRIEYPIELMIMAKAAYPERFSDLRVHEWVLDFYQRAYGVEEAVARKIRSAQWLDWMAEEGF